MTLPTPTLKEKSVIVNWQNLVEAKKNEMMPDW